MILDGESDGDTLFSKPRASGDDPYHRRPVPAVEA